MALAVVLALGSMSVAAAQQSPPTGLGVLVGEVALCTNNQETPAANVAVGVDGGQADLARTDSKGEFSINLAPGQYTVVATADDGTTASRFGVPVQSGQTLDIGILDLGAGVTGCGFDTDVPAAPLASPTATPTTPPLLPTITPTPSSSG